MAARASRMRPETTSTSHATVTGSAHDPGAGGREPEEEDPTMGLRNRVRRHGAGYAAEGSCFYAWDEDRATLRTWASALRVAAGETARGVETDEPAKEGPAGEPGSGRVTADESAELLALLDPAWRRLR
jgi:hypothetical protein